MHEHDQEIIMAIAEGTLDDQAALDAVAACAECSSDLEMQRFAVSALADIPDAYMTAIESASLHTNLKKELSLASATTSRPKRRFAWGKWAPLAGVAAVFLFVVALVPTMLSGGDSDDSSDEVAMIETTEAATEESTASAEAPAATLDESEMQRLQADDAADTAGTDTTAAPAETTQAPTAQTTTTTSDSPTVTDELEYLGTVEELDREALLDLIADDPEAVVEFSSNARSSDPQFDACLEKTVARADEVGIPSDSDPIVMGIVSASTGEELVLVAYVPADLDMTVFAIHQVVVCELVEVLP